MSSVMVYRRGQYYCCTWPMFHVPLLAILQCRVCGARVSAHEARIELMKKD
jgi:hypothetical protein